MSINNTEIISVDFSEPKYIKLNVKQGDNGFRHFVFNCTNKGTPVAIDSETMYAVLKLKRPDGAYVINECTILSNGNIDVEIKETITKNPGVCTAELVLFEKTEVADKNLPDEDSPANTISTMNIIINVFPSAVDNCELEVDNDFSAFNDLVSKMLREYRFIADECNGIIESIKTLNGHKPDENGEYTLQEDDFKIVIDLFNAALEKMNGDVSNRLPLSGGTMTGAINMGGNSVTNLADPKLNGDAASKKYVDSSVSKCTEVCLPLAGGTMTGNINMGSHSITGLSSPAGDSAAVNKQYMVEYIAEVLKSYLQKSGEAMTGSIDMGGNSIGNLGTPENDSDAATKAYVDGRHKTFTATLSKQWTGSGPYTQSVSISGILASDMPHITPNYRSASSDTDEIVRTRIDQWASISYAESFDGGIKFVCMDDPSFDYNLEIKIEVIR